MKKEWKSIFQSTWIKVVLIAITIIPMVYAGVFLGSMWDPYGNADQMPVAVVDKDKEVEYNGSKLHVGETLCENLKDNRSMDFQFVKEGVAKKGLEDGTYYMVITIPEKFSYNATTLLNQNPEKMVLEYATNPGTNYIASKMDETAIRTIKENISKTITKTYADTLFSQVKTLSNGLQEASNGSVKLEDGITQTIVGNDTIKENLITLANSTLQFEDGSKTLKDGVATYTKGVEQLSEGSKQLNEGLQTLKGNSIPLSQGVTKLNDGCSFLREGVDTYTTGVDTLALGLHQVSSNNTALNTGVNEVSEGISQSKAGSEQLLNGMQGLSDTLAYHLSDENKALFAQLLTSHEGIKTKNDTMLTGLNQKVVNGTVSDIEKQMIALLQANTALLSKDQDTLTIQFTALQQVHQTISVPLLSGMKQLDQGLALLDQGMNTNTGLKQNILNYTEGVTKLSQGADTLSANSSNLSSGALSLEEGTTQLNKQMPSLVQGVQQLVDGSSSLYTGSLSLIKTNPTVSSGTNQLYDGSSRIASGASQLANGSQSLSQGLTQVKDGSNQLSISLQDGADKSNITSSEQTKEMLAQPVEVEHEEVSKVETNGKAMAPYMMSVGLYVACMAFTLMYPLLKNNVQTKSGWKLWFSKASVMYVISTVMAILMVSSLVLMNGLSPLQTFKTFLIACLISAAFMSMIVFFNITCGKIGAFLVLIFMVFQLGGAAGTYPIETSSSFYHMIHPFMPFTYSVDAFRHTLALGGSITDDVLVFTGMILVFSTLSILFYKWKVSISEEAFEKTKLAQFH